MPRLAALLASLLLTALLPQSEAAASTTSASALLARLPVATEQQGHQYRRAAFRLWTDEDRDGCDTRAEVLLAESTSAPDLTDGCRVERGRWVSRYDGRTWHDPAAVDIDHVVPLKEAWESGAYAWSAAQRSRFANDLGLAASLIAVTDNVNQSKGDRDPADWLPARRRCRYALDWLQVKYRWRLSVDPREHERLASLLAACAMPQVRVPPRAAIETPTPAPSPEYADVTPGAFCGDHYAYGRTSTGLLMRCRPSDTDTRFRWRALSGPG